MSLLEVLCIILLVSDFRGFSNFYFLMCLTFVGEFLVQGNKLGEKAVEAICELINAQENDKVLDKYSKVIRIGKVGTFGK